MSNAQCSIFKGEKRIKDQLVKLKCFFLPTPDLRLPTQLPFGQKRSFSVKSAKNGQTGHDGFELTGIFKNLQL